MRPKMMQLVPRDASTRSTKDGCGNEANLTTQISRLLLYVYSSRIHTYCACTSSAINMS